MLGLHGIVRIPLLRLAATKSPGQVKVKNPRASLHGYPKGCRELNHKGGRD